MISKNVSKKHRKPHSALTRDVVITLDVEDRADGRIAGLAFRRCGIAEPVDAITAGEGVALPGGEETVVPAVGVLEVGDRTRLHQLPLLLRVLATRTVGGGADSRRQDLRLARSPRGDRG